MPSHGADIIDGIPVVLKDGVMYAFQSTGPQIKLGTYNSAIKVASWTNSEALESWLSSYKTSLTARSRK